MAKFEIVPGLTFMDRGEWGADARFPRMGRPVPRRDRTHVFIHHTVTPDSDFSPNIWEDEDDIKKRMRFLQTARPDLSLDVPYNFVAFVAEGNNLVIAEGRGEDRSGAHTAGHNTRAIGVSFAGNFEELSIEGIDLDRIMELLSYFLGWLKTDPSHPDYGTFPPMTNLGSLTPQGRKVFAHRDVKATACPGKHILNHLDKVDFLDPKKAPAPQPA